MVWCIYIYLIYDITSVTIFSMKNAKHVDNLFEKQFTSVIPKCDTKLFSAKESGSGQICTLVKREAIHIYMQTNTYT